MKKEKVDIRLLGPVLMGFFIMGFCDIVAPISGRIAVEFPAAQQEAVSFLPTMVFLWFLLLSIPLATLTNRIGRKATSLIGYVFTVAGLLVPYFAGEACALRWYLIGFGLLGIGNTAIQVALNPLLAKIAPQTRVSSYLTVGQIFRNTSLLLFAPIVTGLLVMTGSWRLLLPIYAGLTILGGVWLQCMTVDENQEREKTAGLMDCFRQLRNPVVAICVVGIACFIAADVGVGFLSVRLIDRPDAILTTTGFYACRIVGTLIGAYALSKVLDMKYLCWNMIGALVLCVILFFVRNNTLIYVTVALMGFVLSCVFATLYTMAAKSAPGRSAEVAGLMILAISAGAVPGPLIEEMIRTTGLPQSGIWFVAACVAYLLWASLKLQTIKLNNR